MTEKKPLVYVVDDEVDALDVFEEALGLDFEVRTFSRPEEALDVILRNPPECLVSDLIMPNMNGVEFVRNIRRTNKSLPIIVISGYGDKDQIVDIFRLGCFDFLNKPFKYKDLSTKITKIIQQKNSETSSISLLKAGQVVTLSEDNSRLIVKFSKDSLLDKEYLTYVRLQLLKASSAIGIVLSFDFSEVEDVCTDSLIFLKSFLDNLDLENKHYHLDNLSTELGTLLSAELIAYQDAS